MEGIFDYLLVVDSKEQILHLNQHFNRDYFGGECSINKKRLIDVLTSSSLNTFRSAIPHDFQLRQTYRH